MFLEILFVILFVSFLYHNYYIDEQYNDARLIEALKYFDNCDLGILSSKSKFIALHALLKGCNFDKPKYNAIVALMGTLVNKKWDQATYNLAAHYLEEIYKMDQEVKALRTKDDILFRMRKETPCMPE